MIRRAPARALHRSAAPPKELQAIEVRVANRLRQLRADKGLSLAELAAMASISPAYLSRVENHKVSLPLAGLERLANALGVAVAAFFEEDDHALPIVVCRAGQGKQGRIRGPRGFLFELLAADKKGKLMEPMLVDVAAAANPTPLQSHTGDEFNYVLEGECRLVYGKDDLHLRAGDAVYYDAGVPHAALAVDNLPCKLLVVVASRDYLFHGDLSKLLKSEI